jgi:putative CocE/NonD family hydrolase
MTRVDARYDVRLLHDCRVPLRDGLSLSADVYLPLARGPFPTVVQWTPYESTRDRFIAWGVSYAERGYASVVVDVRGRYESEGEFTAYTRDGEDALDTVEWVVSREWCNGRIGTWGRSYGAIVQWQLAPHAHPAVRCLAPHVIMDDYFADCHYVGGAFQLALSLGAALIWSTSMGLVTGESAGRLLLNDRVLRHLPLVELDEQAIGREVACWREWLGRPVVDAYWRSLRHRPEAVTVPVFQQCGWYDAYAGSTLRTFEALAGRVPQRVLMGPWSHEEEHTRVVGGHDFGPEASRVIREDDLRWFDQWLKELDTGILDEPPLSLFVMGVNRWRHESEWPLPGTELTPWYLRSGGRANSLAGDGVLSRDPPGPDEPADRYDYDPAHPVPTIGGNTSILTIMQNAVEPVAPGPADQRPLERRDDVLCYTSDRLDADLEVTGPVEAVIYAASSARDTDVVVRLSDVQPDGRALLLCEGILRARYRYGLDRTELLEPGEVAEYRIRMYPTSNVFRRGHRIRLDVTSSSFPRFSRNLNTGEDVATGTRMEIARQTILHTSAYPSHVLLPIVPA